MSIYVLATTAGILRHVPGGLGVFKSVVLLSLPDAPRDVLLGAVLAYRTLYYLMPLCLAGFLGASTAVSLRGGAIGRDQGLVRQLVGRVAPQLVAVLIFVCRRQAPAVQCRRRRFRDGPGAR
jgi:phosphatidylglycerol lysyltransferase